MNDDAGRCLALADSAFAARDYDGAAEHLSAAIRELSATGDRRETALACARLGEVLANFVGNLTAARAWFLRAKRLIDAEPPCVEQGWVAVAAMGCDVDDPDVLLADAELALERARRFGDVDLEAKALADCGLAHVQHGRIRDGMALLDEAMALVCGPAEDQQIAGKSVCSFFTACYFACDFDRAGSWVELLQRRGVIGESPGSPIYLASHCDAVQATLLCELGQWSAAEAVLRRADAEFERVMAVPSWHPRIALAELRIRQGRLTDAEELLLGREGHIEALLPSARMHLARGDVELARATAERGLRALRDDRLRTAELLALLVDVEIAAGDPIAASERCEQLAARVSEIDVPALRGRFARARARSQAASGDLVAAIETVEEALDTLPGATRLPLLRALLHVDLARLHDAVGNVAAAAVEARRATTALADLDVVLAEEDATLLRRLTDGDDATTASAASAATVRTALLARDGKGWIVTCDRTRAKLGGSKGMQYLAQLVRNPGVERHALDLVDAVEGVSTDGIDRRRLGDAGELLDARARSSYRREIEGLRSEIDDALARGDDTRAVELQEQVDQLVAELARAFGLGGRARTSGSAAERARLNVTRAIRTAISRIRAVQPEVGAALDRGIKTGVYCQFAPAPDEGVRVVVQS
jgi:tetratricopeptide (TPR) repeat protein